MATVGDSKLEGRSCAGSNRDLNSTQPESSVQEISLPHVVTLLFCKLFSPLRFAYLSRLMDEPPRHVSWMTREHLLHGCGFKEPRVVHSKSLPSLSLVTAASAPFPNWVATVSSHSRQKLWPQHNLAAVSSWTKGKTNYSIILDRPEAGTIKKTFVWLLIYSKTHAAVAVKK